MLSYDIEVTYDTYNIYSNDSTTMCNQVENWQTKRLKYFPFLNFHIN